MAFEQPQSRNEAILQNMLGAENELVPPQSRIEALLQAILLQGVPDGAVTTDKLADGAVTYDKLAEALKNLIDGKADKEGNWELIDTITVNETVTSIAKNVDGNGNALELKGIKIFIDLPVDSDFTTAQTLSVEVYAHKDGDIWLLASLYRQNFIGTRTCWATLQAQIKNGHWQDYGNSSYEIDRTIIAPATNDRQSSFSVNKETSRPYARRYQIKNGSGGKIPIGTKIYVYGIK